MLYAPYGGEEAGSGLADVLWGRVNPSARMPVTVYKQAWADSMNCKNFTESPGKPRKYKADCDTSILQVHLLTDQSDTVASQFLFVERINSVRVLVVGAAGPGTWGWTYPPLSS